MGNTWVKRPLTSPTCYIYPLHWKPKRKRFKAGCSRFGGEHKYFPTRKAARDWLAIKYPGESYRAYGVITGRKEV